MWVRAPRQVSRTAGFVAVILAVCGVAAFAAAPRLRIETTADTAQMAELVRLADGAQVIGIGESHDHPAHHAAQAQIVEALARGGAPLALAFEMLTHDQQGAVDAALAESPAATELDARLAWTARGWPDFAMYYPLFELARRYRLPVIAADLDQATVRSVSRRGLGSVADGDRERLRTRLAADAERDDALRRELNDAHCGFLPAAAQGRMAEAWHARNVTIARRILETVDRGRAVVLITGRGHLAPDAVPGQLAQLRPGLRVFVVDLVEDGLGALPAADVTWTTTRMSRPDRCEELRKKSPGWQDSAPAAPTR